MKYYNLKYIVICWIVINSYDGKAEFPFLLSSVSHDPSEIILTQLKTIKLIINSDYWMQHDASNTSSIVNGCIVLFMTTDTKDNLQHFATVSYSRPVLTVSRCCSVKRHYRQRSRPVSAQCQLEHKKHFLLSVLKNVVLLLFLWKPWHIFFAFFDE